MSSSRPEYFLQGQERMYSSHQPSCNSLQVLEAFEEVGSLSFQAHFLYSKSIDAKMKHRDQT